MKQKKLKFLFAASVAAILLHIPIYVAIASQSLHVNMGGETATLSMALNDDGIRVGPNPFTPNNNGFNDFVTFDFSGTGVASHYTVWVYNMSGKHIQTLRTNGRSEVIWNGTDRNGAVLKPGVYIYMIQRNNTVVRRGSITLAL